MIRVVLVIALAPLLFSSCKKDKLEGDMAPLVGTWRYVEGFKLIQYSPQEGGPIYITQDNYDKPFKLEFQKKGILRLIEDGECKRRNRITNARATDTNAESATGFHYSKSYYVSVKDKEIGVRESDWLYRTYYYVEGDTMMTLYWPKPEDGQLPYQGGWDSDPTYHNFFVREN